MKIAAHCMKCVFEGFPYPKDIILHITDNNSYPFTCQNGHKNILVTQEQKFELLFESATHAIRDGYLREAVSSITASLERFYEFFLQVVCDKNGIDESSFNKTWKLLSKQSERQLGAFIFLYTQEFNKTPDLLSNRDVEFRNKVIHQGYFPTFIETTDFGQRVLDFMFEILFILKSAYSKHIANVIRRHNHKLYTEALKHTESPFRSNTTTIIGLNRQLNFFTPVRLIDYLNKNNRLSGFGPSV